MLIPQAVQTIVGNESLIQEIIVGAGGLATVDFTSIPSTYKHLRIEWNAQVESSGDWLEMQFNGDSGANYNRGAQSSSPGGAGQQASTGATSIYFGYTPSTATDGAAAFASGVVEIPFYTSSVNKTAHGHGAPGKPISTSLTSMYFAGAWANTAVINRITIFRAAIDISQGSVFRLLGRSV